MYEIWKRYGDGPAVLHYVCESRRTAELIVEGLTSYGLPNCTAWIKEREA